MKAKCRLLLNDMLHTGPIVQPELIAILMHFCLLKYVMGADTVKIY